ncbi:hypothetical protein B0H13DRAFT_2285785 [Mycena leptocephala]|nr:hypothetical protein B0H13DRAFT_2285785 [Mycena leptocephala]
MTRKFAEWEHNPISASASSENVLQCLPRSTAISIQAPKLLENAQLRCFTPAAQLPRLGSCNAAHIITAKLHYHSGGCITPSSCRAYSSHTPRSAPTPLLLLQLSSIIPIPTIEGPVYTGTPLDGRESDAPRIHPAGVPIGDGTAAKRRMQRHPRMHRGRNSPKAAHTSRPPRMSARIPARPCPTRLVPRIPDARRGATDRTQGKKGESRKGAHRQAPIELFIRLAAPTHLASRAVPPVPRAIHCDSSMTRTAQAVVMIDSEERRGIARGLVGPHRRARGGRRGRGRKGRARGGYEGKQETYYIHDVDPERPADHGRGLVNMIEENQKKTRMRMGTLSGQRAATSTPALDSASLHIPNAGEYGSGTSKPVPQPPRRTSAARWVGPCPTPSEATSREAAWGVSPSTKQRDPRAHRHVRVSAAPTQFRLAARDSPHTPQVTPLPACSRVPSAGDLVPNLRCVGVGLRSRKDPWIGRGGEGCNGEDVYALRRAE